MIFHSRITREGKADSGQGGGDVYVKNYEFREKINKLGTRKSEKWKWIASLGSFRT